MTKYIVLEIQTYLSGEVGTLITQHTNRNEAESKYHSVLSAAAISGLPKHAAVLMTNDGFFIESKSYEIPEDPNQTQDISE